MKKRRISYRAKNVIIIIQSFSSDPVIDWCIANKMRSKKESILKPVRKYNIRLRIQKK